MIQICDICNKWFKRINQHKTLSHFYTEEQIKAKGEKIKAKNTGKKHTKEHNKKISQSNIGRKVTQETRNKISKTLIGHEVTYKTRKNISDTLQTKFTDGLWKPNTSGLRSHKTGEFHHSAHEFKNINNIIKRVCEFYNA